MPSIQTGKLRAYARLVRDLPPYLGDRMTAARARRMVADRLMQREANFLSLLERAVFSRPESTYLALLEAAGFDRKSTSRLVAQLGLDKALQRLDEAGVHLTFEEFKGRTPIERSGLSLPPERLDLANPLAPGHFATESGGSTGSGTRLWLDLDHRHQQGANYYLACEANELLGVRGCLWRPPLPAGSGIGSWLSWSKVGIHPEHWYLADLRADFQPDLSHRLFMGYAYLAARLVGAPFPWPTSLSLDQAAIVARWAAATAAQDGRAYVGASASMALRVALAAQEQDLSLHGVTFAGGGEPLSPAKIERIHATGARLRPSYFLTEAGALGMHCGNPVEVNDQHFFSDCFALRLKPHRLPGSGEMIEAFQLTSLLSSTPRVLINVEIDDYGIVEERECGCALGRAGLTTHMRRVQSYKKLTSEGMSLVGSDMLHILHEVLPKRLGGSPLDYQLEERQDEQGFTRLVLRISPELELDDPQRAIELVDDALGDLDKGSDLARALWREAGSFRIERRAPQWTGAGKLPPLLVHSQQPPDDPPQEQPAGTSSDGGADD